MIRRDIGIMQGRLTGGGTPPVQVFPWATWREEFRRAARVGFTAIEWLITKEDHERNPLWTSDGRAAIAETTRETGVSCRSVCAHAVLEIGLADRPPVVAFTRELILAAASGDLRRVVLPLLEGNSLQSATGQGAALAYLSDLIPVAQSAGVVLALETDLPAEALELFISPFPRSTVRVLYDIGNATADGRDAAEEIRRLSPRIAEIHVKDRVKGGGSRLLGEGDAPFDAVFRAINDLKYEGPIVLETPVGAEAVETARRHLAFVAERWAGHPARTAS